MSDLAPPSATLPAKPISIGLTCWRWQRSKRQAILGLASRLGVTVHLTEKISGFRREIQAEITGQNIDRFIGEFVRRC
jgi:hypothetical protein